MRVDTLKYFKYNINYLRLVGLWFPFRYKTIYNIYSFIVLITITIPIPTLPITYVIIAEKDGILAAAQKLFLSSQLFTLIFKVLAVIKNFDGVLKSVAILKSKEFNSQRPNQDKFLLEAGRLTVRNMTIFLIFCLASLFSWGLVPIASRQKNLPIMIYAPFDVYKNWTIYISIYFYLFIGKKKTGSAFNVN